MSEVGLFESFSLSSLINKLSIDVCSEATLCRLRLHWISDLESYYVMAGFLFEILIRIQRRSLIVVLRSGLAPSSTICTLPDEDRYATEVTR